MNFNRRERRLDIHLVFESKVLAVPKYRFEKLASKRRNNHGSL
jgi:hypothetical protein